MNLRRKAIALFLAAMLAACASMESAKSFNEQVAYADASLDGIVSSLSSQYQAGVITKSDKDAILAQVQKALDAIKAAKGLEGLKNPTDAQASLKDAQLIILQLQQQLTKQGATK